MAGNANSEDGAAHGPSSAVILVGGGGTRLRPLTYAIPKPLVPIVNKPLIVHLIENLRRHGVRRVVLAAAATDRRIEEALGNGASFDLELTYAYEAEPLGSGLAVKQAARDLEGAFFVCNGDVVTDLDLTSMAAQHRERAAAMSIFLAPVEDPSSYGIADLDGTGRITQFIEKPPRGRAPSNLGNAGTWLFEQDVLDHIPDEKMDGSIERLLTPALIADNRLVLAFVSNAYWMDVGTPERYLQIHDDLLSGRVDGWCPEGMEAGPLLGEACDVSADAIIGSRVLLGRACTLGAKASVSGPSVLGDSCSLDEDSAFERSIAWSGVKIGAGARVRDSILGADCLIGEGAIVEEAILANGAMVKRGVHLAPGARLEPGEVAS